MDSHEDGGVVTPEKCLERAESAMADSHSLSSLDAADVYTRKAIAWVLIAVARMMEESRPK